MSPKLPSVAAREVARIAQRLGFELHRQKGSHAVYYREKDKARVVIPMHSNKDIKRKTLAGIIEDMGLSVEDFRKLL